MPLSVKKVPEFFNDEDPSKRICLTPGCRHIIEITKGVKERTIRLLCQHLEKKHGLKIEIDFDSLPDWLKKSYSKVEGNLAKCDRCREIYSYRNCDYRKFRKHLTKCYRENQNQNE